jgi:CTP synthase
VHPFFVASQYHPEFKSRPERPAPLFDAFVGAALERSVSSQPPAQADPAPAGEPSVSRSTSS